MAAGRIAVINQVSGRDRGVDTAANASKEEVKIQSEGCSSITNSRNQMYG